jgi:NADH:ubiquinone oxidoreductase subunit E
LFGKFLFARGNKATLKAIVKYLDDHNLKDKVYFHGGHCFGKCAEGPIVKINSKIFTGIDEYNVIDILTNELNEE